MHDINVAFSLTLLKCCLKKKTKTRCGAKESNCGARLNHQNKKRKKKKKSIPQIDNPPQNHKLSFLRFQLYPL